MVPFLPCMGSQSTRALTLLVLSLFCHIQLLAVFIAYLLLPESFLPNTSYLKFYSCGLSIQHRVLHCIHLLAPLILWLSMIQVCKRLMVAPQFIMYMYECRDFSVTNYITLTGRLSYSYSVMAFCSCEPK